MKPGEVSNYQVPDEGQETAERLARKGSGGSRTKGAATAPAADDLISMAALEAAKKLVKELGGVDKAKRAIESLGRLVD